ncbi:hypothetical protein WJX74_000662 [Apatococcus lobatus]|uniref:Uncharacterized protein n=1 Tax=Apatococcus lobatus TaxID=904363 RepID=A0AAW1PYY9_9CHLO
MADPSPPEAFMLAMHERVVELEAFATSMEQRVPELPSSGFKINQTERGWIFGVTVWEEGWPKGLEPFCELGEGILRDISTSSDARLAPEHIAAGLEATFGPYLTGMDENPEALTIQGRTRPTHLTFATCGDRKLQQVALPQLWDDLVMAAHGRQVYFMTMHGGKPEACLPESDDELVSIVIPLLYSSAAPVKGLSFSLPTRLCLKVHFYADHQPSLPSPLLTNHCLISMMHGTSSFLHSPALHNKVWAAFVHAPLHGLPR